MERVLERNPQRFIENVACMMMNIEREDGVSLLTPINTKISPPNVLPSMERCLGRRKPKDLSGRN